MEALRVIVFELRRLKAPQLLIEQAVTAYLEPTHGAERGLGLSSWRAPAPPLIGGQAGHEHAGLLAQ